MELIDTNTDREMLRRVFDHEGHLSGYRIPADLTAGELESIVRVHALEAYGICVIDLVVAHPNCDAAVIDVILESSEGSSEVLNSVVTSGRATIEQLTAIRDGIGSPGRDHVTMALLEHELRDASEEVFQRVLECYRDDEFLSYPIRYRLATHERTPRSVLRSLASYQDPIGDAARRRLERG